jgi:hypothetical protein
MVALGSAIFHSVSETDTLLDVAFALVVVVDVAVLVVFVVVGAVVAAGGGGGGEGWVVFAAAAACPSLGSRPKKNTANIIPTKSAAVSVRKAGRPRRPGKSGRNAGIRKAEAIAKPTNAAPTSPSPILCPVERAARSTRRGNYRNEGWCRRGLVPTLLLAFSSMRQRKAAPMSAEQLKRKIRNFPVARLSDRLAA